MCGHDSREPTETAFHVVCFERPDRFIVAFGTFDGDAWGAHPFGDFVCLHNTIDYFMCCRVISNAEEL